MDQIRIEPKDGKFAVVLKHGGLIQEMELRHQWEEAKQFAFYLSDRIRLDVFCKGKKLSRK
ncbi:hypothetical protein VE23_06385 [Paenibacillus sp. D9]|nr:hypothetical protein VE23_06385 [Paenibacillus sp. D9]